MAASLQPEAGPSRKRKPSLVAEVAAEEDLGELDLSEGEELLSSDEDDSDLPAIDTGESSEDEEDESLHELELEQQLERELAEEEADSDSTTSSHAVERFLSRHTVKLNEASGDALRDNDLTDEQKTSLLGYDSRDFTDKGKRVVSDVTGENKVVWPEIEPGYASESGDDEPVNRVGKVPAHFYDDMPHIGYDIDGKRVMRPAQGDELDRFLDTVEGSAWTSVEDKTMQANVQLTDEELDLIKRLAQGENPDATYDPYEPAIHTFTGPDKVLQMPLNGRPEPKRRFIPSKWEHKKVMKIVKAIREGRIVPRKPSAPPRPDFYALWTDADEAMPDHPMNMPAPKLKLPGHAESYNPPSEYLFSKQEKKEWEDADPEDRKLDYVPAKYQSLRTVPGYADFVQQRFDRLLDLYLAPRAIRRQRAKPDEVRDPEKLAPKLPNPNELRPFPTQCSLTYPHPNGVRTRCLSIDPEGTWLATGADDGEVRLWELSTGRCQAHWKISSTPVFAVEFSAERGRLLLAASTESKVVLISPLDLLSTSNATATSNLVNAGFSAAGNAPSIGSVRWTKAKEPEVEEGLLIEISVPGAPKQIVWHRRGDYLATVSPDSGPHSVLIHQLSKHQTQAPFKRFKGSVQCVAFHPSRPHFFVATQRFIRLYDLLAQKLLKTLNPGLKWISSIDVHPLGDHLLVGSYDKRIAWHDLELSDRPFKTLRFHSKAVRTVAFHPRQPLFASASDDGTIHVLHSTVYSDLVTEPLLVPLRSLRGHAIKEGLGVLAVRWHPREAWCISVAADGCARLWTN